MRTARALATAQSVHVPREGADGEGEGPPPGRERHTPDEAAHGHDGGPAVDWPTMPSGIHVDADAAAPTVAETMGGTTGRPALELPSTGAVRDAVVTTGTPAELLAVAVSTGRSRGPHSPS